MTLGRIHITIDDRLDEQFRAEVSKRIGFKKGNLQVAIEEAIQDWIDKGRKKERP